MDAESESTKPDVNDHTMDVVEEDLNIEKRDVERGRVRIHSRVEEIPYEEQVDVREDVVSVERIPMDIELDTPPEPRQEGDVTVLPVIEEVVVVTKRYRLVEEIRISKRSETHTETVRTSLKRQDVDITADGEIE